MQKLFIHYACLNPPSSVNVPRHASLLRLALTNSSFAFCMNNFCTAPKSKNLQEMHGGKGTAGCAAELISGSLDDVFASPDSEPHFTILKRQGIKVL